MSSKVRQLSKEEILPEDLNIAAVTINRTIEFYSAPEFYGKARAYFFTNFWFTYLYSTQFSVRRYRNHFRFYHHDTITGIYFLSYMASGI